MNEKIQTIENVIVQKIKEISSVSVFAIVFMIIPLLGSMYISGFIGIHPIFLLIIFWALLFKLLSKHLI